MKKIITAFTLCLSIYLSAQAQSNPAPINKDMLKGKTTGKLSAMPELVGLTGQVAPHKKSDDAQKTGEFMMALPTHLIVDQTGTVVYHEWVTAKIRLKNFRRK